MQTTQDRTAIENKSVTGKYLTFAISKEIYGVEILKVQEIIGVPHITHVPKVPDYVKGVINLRGKIIPIVDIRLRFGLEAIAYDEKTCIIVIDIQKADQKVAVGVIVDTVHEVVNYSSNEIEAAPDYGSQIDSRLILGLGRKANQGLSILVDIEKVLVGADLPTTSPDKVS